MTTAEIQILPATQQRSIVREIVRLQAHLGGMTDVVSFGSDNGGLIARHHIRSAGRVCDELLERKGTNDKPAILSIHALRRDVARVAGSLFSLAAMLEQASGEPLDLTAESKAVAENDRRDDREAEYRSKREAGDGHWMRAHNTLSGNTE